MRKLTKTQVRERCGPGKLCIIPDTRLFKGSVIDEVFEMDLIHGTCPNGEKYGVIKKVTKRYYVIRLINDDNEIIQLAYLHSNVKNINQHVGVISVLFKNNN